MATQLSFKQKNSLIGFLKQIVGEMLQQRTVINQFDASQTCLGPLTRLMLNLPRKPLRDIHLYEGDNVNVLGMDALKTFDVLWYNFSTI